MNCSPPTPGTKMASQIFCAVAIELTGRRRKGWGRVRSLTPWISKRYCRRRSRWPVVVDRCRFSFPSLFFNRVTGWVLFCVSILYRRQRRAYRSYCSFFFAPRCLCFVPSLPLLAPNGSRIFGRCCMKIGLLVPACMTFSRVVLGSPFVCLYAYFC